MRPQLFLSLLLISGCAHKQTQTTTAPKPSPPATVVSQAKPPAPPPAPVGTCSSDSDCQTSQLCNDGRCVDAASLPECVKTRTHFDFDKSELHAADQTLLDKFARCVKAQPAAHFVIAGHCDERGTEEYNMALGDRRAQSVAAYLESIGVAKERLRTVSYGKERPLCGGHEESCWWQNRRAALGKEASQAAR